MRQSDKPASWLERLAHVLSSEPQNKRELINLLRDTKARQWLDLQALGMVEGVLQISDKQVRDIMVPRAQMVTVANNQSPEAFLPIVIESGHSRFPVIGESKMK
jgi:magnesium and cobalt transporter